MEEKKKKIKKVGVCREGFVRVGVPQQRVEFMILISTAGVINTCNPDINRL